MRELLESQKSDRESITEVTQKHQVCPFELSLDVSRGVDVVIGDYNYVFDPTVILQRYFGEGKAKHVTQGDEAHNLVDRSREMYSASLMVADLIVPQEAMGGKGQARRGRRYRTCERKSSACLQNPTRERLSQGLPPRRLCFPNSP